MIALTTINPDVHEDFAECLDRAQIGSLEAEIAWLRIGLR